MKKACNINTLLQPTDLNMKAYFLGFLLIVASFCQAQSLSESSTISLLTASPGEELYSTFGHSAIRVQDPASDLDVVFNYGVFDDREPNFYFRFTRRKVDYFLSMSNFDSFIRGYVLENRSIVEQILNLDANRRRQLYALLLENFKPENRFYRYDFFFDNCATRIRDLIPEAFGKDFSYNYPEDWLNGELTFRNLIDLYLTNHHWSDFGIDLALGLPTDDIATPSDYMFLPDYLMEGFATATIVHDGALQPLVLSTREILPRTDIPAAVFFMSPMKVCWGIFVITLLLSTYGYKHNKVYGWFDVIFFSAIGLVGWIVFFLDFLTDHIATKENLNMLWAVPLHLPLFLFWRKLPWNFRKYYLSICLGIDLIIISFWWVFPQNYHAAFIPLILALSVRYLLRIKMGNKNLREI
jgi:hypothetical protein